MNWDILGHEWAVDLLREHLIRKQVRHAYLFTGPQGVGRRTLALRLAQALNCQHTRDGNPCLTCRVCSQIERLQYADLTVIERLPDKTQILVDQVRELQHTLALSAYGQGYRIALLLHMEEASIGAQNALLKTLEEPNEKVVLLLTAEPPEHVLPTIASRCETLRLRPAPLAALAEALQQRWDADPGQARLLAHISGGRTGAARQLLQDPQRLELRRTWLDAHLELMREPLSERFAYAEALTKEKDRFMQRAALLDWLSLRRDVMLQAAGSSAPLSNLDYQAQIEALAHSLGLQNAHRVVAAIEQTQDRLQANVNARLALEIFMLDLPRVR